MSISLEKLVESKTNPRKRFDEQGIRELADSMKKGQVVPCLVRPIAGGKYELVCGARRFRAAKLAGIKTLECCVSKDMTDNEVGRVQLVENLQRADLHPMEEAEQFEALINKHGLTVEQAADQVGKSRKLVSVRLSLLRLVPKARKMFEEGKISVHVAYLVARCPVSGQMEAIEKAEQYVESGLGHTSEMLEDLANELLDQYTRELKNAPFPLDLACEGKPKCGACPHRSSQEKDLFGDAGKGDRCLDGKCWEMKRVFHQLAMVKEAKDKGMEVIRGAEAKRCFSSYGTHHNWDGHRAPYVQSGDSATRLEGVKATVTWGELAKKLGKPGVKQKVLVGPDGVARRVWDVAELTKALVAGKVIKAQSAPRAQAVHTETPEQKAARLRKVQAFQACYQPAVELLTTKVLAMAPEKLVELAHRLKDSGFASVETDIKKCPKHAKASRRRDLPGLVLREIGGKVRNWQTNFDGDVQVIAAAAGVDLKKLERAALENIKVAEAAAAKKPATAKARK